MTQYFSHLNGLVLGNNWGDLIRLLDKALVTGLALPNIVTVSLETGENIRVQFTANHNTLLFQLVELQGFLPENYNSAFRVVGVPSATELILRVGTSIAIASPSVRGTAKLQSLGYEIVFRDVGDVKRVYRAKNPTAQHPFIRVDESLASPDGTSGVYTDSYSKFAMVGLLGHMSHIDDYQNPNVLQLPFDPDNPAKNWTIAGVGSNVVRGWSRWYWASERVVSGSSFGDANTPTNGSRAFNLFGGSDSFYLITQVNSNNRDNLCLGCGLYEDISESSIIQPWFLTTVLYPSAASETWQFVNAVGCTPFIRDTIATGRVSDSFLTTAFNELSPVGAHEIATAIAPDSYSGRTNIYPNWDISALEVPFITAGRLRGMLPLILYAGKVIGSFSTLISGKHMYLTTPVGARAVSGQYCGYYVYLGELE